MKKYILGFILFFLCFDMSGQEVLKANQVGFITKIGDRMPAFKVDMLDGSVLDSKTLKGKVVLLDFWGAKCGGCLLALKRFPEEIIKVYEKRKDFFVLPVEAQNHSREEIEVCARRMGFHFPLAYENGKDIAGLFINRNFGLPRTLIIDRKGKIVYQAYGYTDEEFAGMLTVLKETMDDVKR